MLGSFEGLKRTAVPQWTNITLHLQKLEVFAKHISKTNSLDMTQFCNSGSQPSKSYISHVHVIVLIFLNKFSMGYDAILNNTAQFCGMVHSGSRSSKLIV